MKKITIKIIMLFTVFLVASAVETRAEEDQSLPIQSGMYTVTITTSSTATKEPMTKVVDMCISDQKIYPRDYMPKAANCEIENFTSKNKGKEAEFDIVCQGGEVNQGTLPELSGQGKCSSIEGFYCSFNLAGKMLGKDFKIDSLREGQRMGECL